MKKFKQLLCLALALTISASLLAACGQKDNGGSKDSDEKVLTYAVEGGSAGEEIALEKGWKITTLEDQAAALMEVASGTSDAAIIDLLMAGGSQWCTPLSAEPPPLSTLLHGRRPKGCSSPDRRDSLTPDAGALKFDLS